MKQREVQDDDNTIWTCVQAFSGSNGDAAEEATKRTEEKDGPVTVVCTPSGGAQSVRLDLGIDWETKLSDQQLVDAIHDIKDKS